MFSLKKFKVVAIIVVAAVGTLSLYQNCSDVNFETTDELLKAGIDGTLRSVSFSPKFTENRPNIDVTTILDNSNSMTKIQSNVKEALSSTTSVLKGFSGSFNLYTSTQEMSYSSRNKDELGYYKIQDENGELIPSLTFTANDLPGYKALLDDDLNPVHSTFEVWKKHLNYSPYKSLAFSKSMNDSEFKGFQNEVGTEIQKVDTSGSATEVTLCSLLRNLDANQDSNSFHTYIIATNEDDASSAETCLKEEGTRYNRQTQVNPGGQENCNPGDAGCNFPYTVTYRPFKRERSQYRTSSVEWQRIYFNLVGKGVVTKNRTISYSTTRRFVTHRLRQNSYTFDFLRKVVAGSNDGIPFYNDNVPQSSPHLGRGTNYGACGTGSTSPVDCSGADLTYFNTQILALFPDLKPGTCKIKCVNTTTPEDKDYIDSIAIAVGSTVTYPEVTSANLSGYSSGCHAYVAQRNGYTTSTVPNSAIDSCNTSNDGLASNTPSYQISKTYDTCSGFVTTCTDAEKSQAITQLGLSGITASLLSCSQSCSSADLASHLNSNRVTAGNLCPTKSPGSSVSPDYTDSCTSAELTSVKTTLQNALTAQNITGVTLNDSDVSCGYSCRHQNSSTDHITISSATVNLDPWANPSNQTGLDCNQPPFDAVVNNNKFSCRKVYDDQSTPANGTFISDNPDRCLSGVTLSTIRSYPEAAAIQDYGTARPMISCTRGQGKRGAADTITYNWPAENPVSQSLVGGNGIVKSLKEKLALSHGKNYFVAAFINDPSKEEELCEGVNLEDYYGPAGSQLEYEGKKFKSLEKELGSKQMKTFPACMPDYKQAMKFIFDLIVTSAKKSYTLALSEEKKEWVYRVKILDKYGIVQTLKEEQYSWDKGLLNFDDSVDLNSVEMVYVDIVVPNLPAVKTASQDD